MPLEDVAQSAGVAIATVYRRFPNRAGLLTAAFERNIMSYVEAVDRALAKRRPWDGFRCLILELCALQASEPLLRGPIPNAFLTSPLIEQRTAEVLDKIGEVVTRAQREGSLRTDVRVVDVVVMLLANAHILEATGGAAPRVWPRFVALMVDALHGSPDGELPPPIQLDELCDSIMMAAGIGCAAVRHDLRRIRTSPPTGGHLRNAEVDQKTVENL
ncbi:TetR/AcrR family transcriptional regulator [Mycobacterium pinniadriaticum]|uniref:TetR/AcrR family transcriptional regulator n=1 Tax=Mycobacterium pinniadriaticum TaxID=2994102 RepID=UPI00389960C6